jgi:hypothetical protein
MFTANVRPMAFRLRASTSTCGTRLSICYRGTVQTRKYSTPVDLPVPNKTKLWESAEEAVEGDAIKSGDTLLCGGVLNLIYAVMRTYPLVQALDCLVSQVCIVHFTRESRSLI